MIFIIVSFYYLKKKSKQATELKRNAKAFENKIIIKNDISTSDKVVIEELENPFKKIKKMELSQLPDDVLELKSFLKSSILIHYYCIISGKLRIICYITFFMIILMQKAWKAFILLK